MILWDILLSLNKEKQIAASWLKKYLTMKPEVNQIYDDLDAYREFCVKQGYNFDERHLYHEKNKVSKYSPPPEGVPEGEARGNSRRRRAIFDRISRVES